MTSVKCVMASYALMWRRSVECEVCNGELCTDVLAMCWRCVGGAVKSVKCVMESYALLWRRCVECEVCNGELCTGVLAVYWRRG